MAIYLVFMKFSFFYNDVDIKSFVAFEKQLLDRHGMRDGDDASFRFHMSLWERLIIFLGPDDMKFEFFL